MVKDKDLETMIHAYFENEVPEPNQQLLDDLKTKMHERKTLTTKRFNKKFRLALASCMLILLIIPAIAIPIVWNNNNSSTPPSPFTPPVKEEIYYSDSTLSMVDLTPDELNSIFVGEFSKYSTFLEDYTINTERGYYGEDNVLVYIKLEITKNIIPFTNVELNIVFVENYEHLASGYFANVDEFIQYDNCKLYETTFTMGYKKGYRKLVVFENYKVYLQLDKQDSSIINTIIQN